MNAMKVIGFLLFIASIAMLVKAQISPSSGLQVSSTISDKHGSSTVAPKGKGNSNPIISLLSCILENVGNLLGISLGGIVKDLGSLISSDGSLNLSGLLSDVTAILNIPLDAVFSALQTGNLSQLTKQLQPLVDSLLNIPIVGSILLLLSNVLQIPVSLVVAVLSLVLHIVKALLSLLLGIQVKF
ncbi:uncharacterized protein LOC122719769 [Apis laboriosa]|uniref:uncharacterized protein LOC122719769 n=1 Tax=Apis laboriosa TaxID=183418 RepID=UPI001CC61A20|nr:uncharacterized protein LOC122719769 [Apis laboriosa]